MMNNVLMDIMETANVLKSDIVLLYGNSIFGTDIKLTYLLRTDFNNTNNLIMIFNIKDMKDFIKLQSSIDEININNSHVYSSNGTSISIFNIEYYTRIINMINNVNIIMNNSILYQNTNLREDLDFEQILQHKTAEGAFMYNIENKFPIFIYNNLLPVNKGDSVSITIFNDTNIRFLSRFDITKKKKVKVEVYIVYRYL